MYCSRCLELQKMDIFKVHVSLRTEEVNILSYIPHIPSSNCRLVNHSVSTLPRTVSQVPDFMKVTRLLDGTMLTRWRLCF